MLIGYIVTLVVGAGLWFGLAKVPFNYRCLATLLITVCLLVSWTVFILRIGDKPQGGARVVDPNDWKKAPCP